MIILDNRLQSLFALYTQRHIMRVLSFLFILVFIQSSCNNSHINLQNEKEVRKAISGKWQSTYIETMGNRGKVPDAQIQVVSFNENGTFSAGAKDGMIKHNGKWNYDRNSHILYMGEGDEKGPAKILKLTDKELIDAEYIIMNDKIVDSIVMTYNKL
jgi:hypothetical protein